MTAVDQGLTAVDLFCGAGGSMSGLAAAGFELVLGANHSERAIETASANFADTDFLCTDINHYDMRRLPKARVLWASVICTEISPAGGNRKMRGQQAFEELGHVPSDVYERTRACALDVVRATEVHRYEAVIVENVVEFARDWELYDWWVEGMCTLGYRVQVVNASAAHVYGESNGPAPQWRDRIFIVFTRNGIDQPDLELRPPSWCEVCDGLVDGVQWWKRTDRRRVGKYGSQYLYRCPHDSSIVEPLVLPAIAALDLDDLGERIGDRRRPLSPRTMARIQWGFDTFVQPVIAQVAGNTYEHGEYRRAWPALDAPLTARQATGTDAVAWPSFLVVNRNNNRPRLAEGEPMAPLTTGTCQAHVVPPLMVNHGHTDARVYPSDGAPLPTRTVKIGDGVMVAPFITMLRRNGTATSTTDEPLATVATSGTHHWLTTPGFLVKNFGGNAQPQHLSKPLTQPLGAITTHDHHALVIPYRRGARARRAVDQPLPTTSTKTSEGVLQPSVTVEDCFYRTLKPREHLRGQRFADSYIVTGNIGEQTMQAGNAVPCNVAQWIGERLAEVLG